MISLRWDPNIQFRFGSENMVCVGNTVDYPLCLIGGRASCSNYGKSMIERKLLHGYIGKSGCPY